MSFRHVLLLPPKTNDNLTVVYDTSNSVVDAPAPSDQPSRLREQLHPSLPNKSQPSLIRSSIQSDRKPSPGPVCTLAETKQAWRDWWEHSSSDTSGSSSELGQVDGDYWASEEREVKQHHDEVVNEGDAGEEENKGRDWLDMASFKQPQTITHERLTVRHRKEPRYISNNSFKDPGSVITISDGEEGQLSYRTMVVMARSDELALQCVSLCPHPGINSRNCHRYSTTHVPVYDAAGATAAMSSEFKKDIQIEFDSQNTRLLNHCLINCQHVWTIRTGVKYAEEGHVQNFNDLLDFFSEIQKKLYKDVRRQVGLED